MIAITQLSYKRSAVCVVGHCFLLEIRRYHIFSILDTHLDTGFSRPYIKSILDIAYYNFYITL